MSSEETTPNTNMKQVTVEVPEERLAEFHVFYGRFLAGWPGRRGGPGRRGRYGRPHGRHGHPGHHGPHGGGCARRRYADEPTETAEQAPASDIAEV